MKASYRPQRRAAAYPPIPEALRRACTASGALAGGDRRRSARSARGWKRTAALLVLCASMSACGGWHLRGTSPGGALTKAVYVRFGDAYTVGNAVRREIVNRGGRVVGNIKQADLLLDIDDERFERRILSIDPDSGKVREIELALATTFTVRTTDGKLLVPRQEITWQDDYVFDEGSVLGTVEKDDIVQRDLAETAATAIVLRLEAAPVPRAEAAAAAQPAS